VSAREGAFFLKEKLESRSFPALDALRGIAAILVVQFHIRGLFSGYSASSESTLGDGYLAVDLFFSLSGFVLAHIYLPRFRDGMSIIEFIRVRVIRLYPLYFLGLVMGSVLLTISLRRVAGFSFSDIVPTIVLEAFFLPAKLENSTQLFPINNVAWSLFFELIVNLFFVALWRMVNFRALSAILILSGAVFFSLTFSNQAASLGNTWDTLYGGFFRATFSFSYGVFIHHLYREGKLRIKTNPAIFVLSAITLCVSILLPVENHVRPYFDSLFIVLIAPILVVIGVNVQLSGRLAKLSSFLGASSYAIYCLHYPALSVIVFLTKKYFGDHPPVLTVTVVSVAIFLVTSYFIDLFYDIPVRRFLMARTKPNKAMQPTITANP
jgi:peptidoglycan/LPS O-acetylase OafA/YrhL